MKYGTSYYPEQKTKTDLEHDIELMKVAGLNTVRMGEFAWCAMEPSNDVYNFDWLDDAVDRLARAGIDTVLCTPTACPPAWLVERHPEILYRDNRGVRRPFGGRRHYCYSSPVYRYHSQRIAEKLGGRYGRHPHVIGFQIDNELAQEGTGRCHCEVCRDSFRLWLEKKYVAIERLNERAGTIFWGQSYTHFGQIEMPVNTIEPAARDTIDAFYENPTLRLDYERFCSDSLTEYQNTQCDALRRYSDKTITTNATGLATNSIDYYAASGGLDVYAFDYYPGLREERISSLPYAFARGTKGKRFWLLEFTSGGGHRLGGSGRLQPYPGALKQAVVHAFLSGAEMVLHFQFRAFPFGAEQLNYALVDADGKPRRRFREVQETSAELARLERLFPDGVYNDVAICFSYDSLWSLKIKPVNEASFSYLDFCTEFYESLVACGVGVDVVSLNADLSAYKLVVAPAPFVMSEEQKERFRRYVHGGGVLLATFLAGAKNLDNNGVETSLPGGLTELFGIEVAEVEPVFAETAAQIELDLPHGNRTGVNRSWTEVLEPNGAEVVGTYADTFRKGAAVVSRHRYGNGTAYYLGTAFEPELLAALLRGVLIRESIIEPSFTPIEGVEIVPRHSRGRLIYCLFNFNTHEVIVPLNGDYLELESEKPVGSAVVIAPKGYVFIEPVT